MAITYLTVEHLPTKDLIRFFSKVTITDNCWQWTAGTDQGGYGRFKWKGLHRIISRFIYAWLIEPVPSRESNMEVDHLCKNRSCCNPLHLELVPKPINAERSNNPAVLNSRKTHCKYGHEFTPENTLYRIRENHGKGLGRECVQCIKNRARITLPARLAIARRRYAVDNTYRSHINASNNERHRLNMQNPEYREKRRLQSIENRRRKKSV